MVGKRDYRVRSDEPQSLDLSGDGGLDDVGIGKATGRGDAVGGNVPEPGQFFAVFCGVELAIAGERRCEARLAGSHGVALSGDGKGCGASAADISCDVGEAVDSVHRDRALRRVVDTHVPADERAAGTAIEERCACDLGFGESSDGGDVRRGEGRDEAGEFVKAGHVLRDVVAVDEAFADQDVGDAVEQRDVGAGLDGEVEIGHHGGLGDAGVDCDEGAGLGAGGAAIDPLAENGMVVGDVGADEQDDVGSLHVGVGAGRPIGAEGELVASDSGGHAEGSIPVVIAGAEAELPRV